MEGWTHPSKANFHKRASILEPFGLGDSPWKMTTPKVITLVTRFRTFSAPNTQPCYLYRAVKGGPSGPTAKTVTSSARNATTPLACLEHTLNWEVGSERQELQFTVLMVTRQSNLAVDDSCCQED